jgi:DNA-binding IclR family transcriptional regulator
MVLDHYIRQADIVLQHAIPFMKELRTLTGFDCVVSGLYGQQILDTHQELSATPSKLSYGRGRPRPLFRGAAPKVILASFTPAHLRKVFDANIAELGTSGLPLQWPDFRKQYSSVHKAGYYLSMGEVDQDIAAIAVPLVIERKGLLCALTLVTSVDRMNLTDQSKLIQMLQRTALDIKTRIP